MQSLRVVETLNPKTKSKQHAYLFQSHEDMEIWKDARFSGFATHGSIRSTQPLDFDAACFSIMNRICTAGKVSKDKQCDYYYCKNLIVKQLERSKSIINI